MSGVGQTSGLSRAVDLGSAGLFAGAAGYSAFLLASPAAGFAAVAIAFVGAHWTLGRIDGSPGFSLPAFGIGEIEAVEEELLLTEHAELLLTDVYTVEEEGELLLDDPLAAPSEDSRVIRLFDPRLLPTAGELREGIEKHLSQNGATYPDAAFELHEALAALKGSLR